jgi:hypothetical protein
LQYLFGFFGMSFFDDWWVRHRLDSGNSIVIDPLWEDGWREVRCTYVQYSRCGGRLKQSHCDWRRGKRNHGSRHTTHQIAHRLKRRSSRDADCSQSQWDYVRFLQVSL